jgi:hypothetical protein
MNGARRRTVRRVAPVRVAGRRRAVTVRLTVLTVLTVRLVDARFLVAVVLFLVAVVARRRRGASERDTIQ